MCSRISVLDIIINPPKQEDMLIDNALFALRCWLRKKFRKNRASGAGAPPADELKNRPKL